jgi:hypothetical protein
MRFLKHKQSATKFDMMGVLKGLEGISCSSTAHAMQPATAAAGFCRQCVTLMLQRVLSMTFGSIQTHVSAQQCCSGR